MKMTEALIAWTPETDEVDVVPWPDRAHRSDAFLMTVGACDAVFHKMSRHQQCAMLFINFNTVVVRDRVPVEAAHRAFLKIDEYRQLISPDTPGADLWQEGPTPLGAPLD